MEKSNQKQFYSFHFEGNTYNGYVVSSTDILPHFHWFVFEDRKVIAKYGDSIAFKVVNDELTPLYHLTSPDFVAAVQHCLQNCLKELRQVEDEPAAMKTESRSE